MADNIDEFILMESIRGFPHSGITDLNWRRVVDVALSEDHGKLTEHDELIVTITTEGDNEDDVHVIYQYDTLHYMQNTLLFSSMDDYVVIKNIHSDDMDVLKAEFKKYIRLSKPFNIDEWPYAYNAASV